MWHMWLEAISFKKKESITLFCGGDKPRSKRCSRQEVHQTLRSLQSSRGKVYLCPFHDPSWDGNEPNDEIQETIKNDSQICLKASL